MSMFGTRGDRRRSARREHAPAEPSPTGSSGPRLPLLLAAGIAAVFGVAACGGSDSGSGGSSSAAGNTAAEAGGALQPGTLKLGMTAALSGFLPFDDQISNGMKLAVKEINDAGGIDGKVKLDLQVKDTKSDTGNVVKLTQEFIDGGTKVVFAECNADAQVAAAAVAQRGGAVELSACNAEPKIGKQYPNYWGVGLSPNVTMAAAAQYAAKNKGYKTVYMLSSTDLLYNKTLQGYFKDAAAKLGMKVVGEDFYKVGATDYASNITKIKNLNPKPDVIFSSIFVPDSGTFVKQLRAAGVTVPVISGDGSDSPLLTKIGGKGAEGTCVVTHAFPVQGEPTEAFYGKYKTEYGVSPDTAFAGVGYNNVKLLAAAVQKAKSTDPNAIAKALSGGMKLAPPDALWDIDFPAGQHWPNYKVPVICVQDGAFKRDAYLTPDYIPPVK
jgi:branched-chain amino acid transport system substrate-binding protein